MDRTEHGHGSCPSKAVFILRSPDLFRASSSYRLEISRL
ncbi:hypothetical protein UCMB321_2750 [Pseudomonas batumici]|uniref:Uncharacterized protein n=1 Tax=Pseudomonas batumici TaxID=226910 RepID=A0A0C2ECJ4_9PSED|nr:hypothetical protein UCMB321_2750 [Pseudomonas batumici]